MQTLWKKTNNMNLYDRFRIKMHMLCNRIWMVDSVDEPMKLRVEMHGKMVARFNPGGGGDPAYERSGDACRKFWIKPLKETDLGVAQAFFDP